MKRCFAVIFAIALILLGTALGLAPLARENAQRAHVYLMETILPGGRDFVRLPYTGEDSVIRSVHEAAAGYVVETATRGYADDIVMLIGVDKSGKVTGMVTLQAHETLGLGSKILSDHAFLAQFLNQTGAFTVGAPSADAFSGATVQSTPTDKSVAVDGISGATVSSKAVARCVSSAVAYVTGADATSSATTWGK